MGFARLSSTESELPVSTEASRPRVSTDPSQNGTPRHVICNERYGTPSTRLGFVSLHVCGGCSRVAVVHPTLYTDHRNFSCDRRPGTQGSASRLNSAGMASLSIKLLVSLPAFLMFLSAHDLAIVKSAQAPPFTKKQPCPPLSLKLALFQVYIGDEIKKLLFGPSLVSDVDIDM